MYGCGLNHLAANILRLCQDSYSYTADVKFETCLMLCFIQEQRFKGRQNSGREIGLLQGIQDHQTSSLIDNFFDNTVYF